MKKYALISSILFISLAVFVSSCVQKPDAELQKAQSSLAAAKDAGARDLAASDYQAAENKLDEGKKLYDKECYKKAKPVLEEAANLADIAKQKALAANQPAGSTPSGAATGTCPCANNGTCAAGKCPSTCPCASGTCPSSGACMSGSCPQSGTCPAGKTCPCGSSAAPGATTQPSSVDLYIVKKGDCLWNISKKKEIYNDPYEWPIIFNANKSKIKNPDLIYPKQSLSIPQNPSQEEINKAWKKTGKPGVKKETAAKHKIKKAEPKKTEAAAETPKEEPAKKVKKADKPKKEKTDTEKPKEEAKP
jgi:nucleoid-associated protein YgaU